MRRRVLVGAAACSAIGPSLVACSVGTDEQEAARALRRPSLTGGGDQGTLMRELVRYFGAIQPQHPMLALPYSGKRQCDRARFVAAHPGG